MPTVLLTGHYTQDYYPLGKQLKSKAEQLGGRFVRLEDLLDEKGVDRVELEGEDHVDNFPVQIAALGEMLQTEAGGKPTLIMIDELPGYFAPVEEERAICNWLALKKIPSDVFVVLLFNPGQYDGNTLLLPSSCLRLHLSTTYRSTKSITNLHACLAIALKENAPSGNPGTEAVGVLPKLVVMGDLGKLEEEEMANRIRIGFDMVKRFVAGKEESDVTLINNSGGLYDLLAKQAEEFSWTLQDEIAMYGGEADRVAVIGVGELETISRARHSLALLFCCHDESSRENYNFFAPGYQAAIEQGLVEVAIPPWHPEVRLSFQLNETIPSENKNKWFAGLQFALNASCPFSV